MKRIWLSMIGAGLLMVGAFAPAAAQDIITLQLSEVDDSGISGNANISERDGQAVVSILVLEGRDDDAVHPVHVHEGTCADLGDVAYPLEDIVEGRSETTLEISKTQLQVGGYAINAHLSEDDMDTNIMCANIPRTELIVDEADDEAAEEDDAEATEADDEDATEADDAVEEDDEEADDVAALLPATGGVGANPETIIMLMVLLASVALGAGVMVRRRTSLQG